MYLLGRYKTECLEGNRRKKIVSAIRKIRRSSAYSGNTRNQKTIESNVEGNEPSHSHKSRLRLYY